MRSAHAHIGGLTNVERLNNGSNACSLEEDVKDSTSDRRSGGAVDGGPTLPGGGMSVPGVIAVC